MSSTPIALTRQFLSAPDMAAFIFGLLAVLYVALWWRDRERGMSWLAVSFALMAVVFANMHRHMPQGPYVQATGWFTVIMLAVMSMTVGIVEYLPTPWPARRRWLLALLAPSVLLIVLFNAGVPVLRSTSNLIGSLPYVGTGLLALAASRQERGAGHALVGLALLSIPGVGLGAALLGLDAVVIRYYGALPLMFFGITLLTTSLLRRRRALEAEVSRRARAERALITLNMSLEEQVGQRTADLQGMVSGLESFNRSVSHDLRGPLGGIAGTARLALEGLQKGDPAPALRMLPAIISQAEVSTQLVASLLELARVGDAHLQRRRVDLRAVVDDAVRQIALADPTRPMPALHVGALPEVEADAELLRPVFVNLIGNARKFAAACSDARIDIGASSEAGEVTVFVRDNGVGFDAHAARRLFEPFVRLHGPRFEGTGVGLSIVRRAVERHGGRVWAQAEPERGACFYFTLPTAPAAA
jgi:signal transduction histidine kinase